MANIGQFNPNAQAPLDGGYIPLPKGEWNAQIVDSKIEGTDASNTKLVLTFEVNEGTAKGAKVDVYLFLWTPADGNKGGGKGEISRRKLTSISNALGIFQEFNDTNILHNRPLTLRTDIRFVAKQDGTGYMEFGDIKEFKQFVGTGRAAGADPVQPQAPGAGMAPAHAAPSLPTAPAFGGMPQAPAFAPPAPPTAFAPPQAPAGFAPPAPPAAPGGFAPPMAPAPQQFAPPAAPGAYQPPQFGAPPPFGAPR